MQREHLQRKFNEAGLRGVIGVPRMVRDRDIFSMTISNERGRGERFVVNPGAVGNRVEVLDVNPKEHQLLLFVEEPRRKIGRCVLRNGKSYEAVLGACSGEHPGLQAF